MSNTFYILTLSVIGIVFICWLLYFFMGDSEDIEKERYFINESNKPSLPTEVLKKDRKTSFSRTRLHNSNPHSNPIRRRGSVYSYIDNQGDEIVVPKHIYDSENNSSSYDSSSDSGGCDGGGD